MEETKPQNKSGIKASPPPSCVSYIPSICLNLSVIYFTFVLVKITVQQVQAWFISVSHRK